MGIELARAELFLVVARLVTEFGDKMRLFETEEEEEVEFVQDYQVALPGPGSKGVTVIVD